MAALRLLHFALQLRGIAIDRISMSLFSEAAGAARPGPCEMTGIRHMPNVAGGFTNYHKFWSCEFRDLPLFINGHEGAQFIRGV